MPRTKFITPNLRQVVTQAIQAALADQHVGLPAKVLAFDQATQSCDVQTLLQRTIIDASGNEKTFDFPPITDVPVLYPAGGGWALTFPLAPGDTVYLAFAERSLDDWLTNGGTSNPQSTRKFDLSDAVAIACLRARNRPLPITTGLRLGREDGSVVLQMDGTQVTIIAPSILLGQGADAPGVRGTDLISWLTSHTHPVTGALGVGVANPTLIPPPNSILSTIIKIK